MDRAINRRLDFYVAIQLYKDYIWIYFYFWQNCQHICCASLHCWPPETQTDDQTFTLQYRLGIYKDHIWVYFCEANIFLLLSHQNIVSFPYLSNYMRIPFGNLETNPTIKWQIRELLLHCTLYGLAFLYDIFILFTLEKP